MRTRASTSFAGGFPAAFIALALLLPAAASATISEVGLITKTEPETVPSCTTGPMGSAGKAIEEEAKATEEAEKKKVAEEEKKKKEAEKKKKEAEAKKKTKTTKTAEKASVARHSAHAARSARSALRAAHATSRSFGVTGGADSLAAVVRMPALATVAATTTTETTKEEATSTTSTESPCLAISRTTGFQTKVGSINNPLVIPHNGRIVAWTIDLGRPTATQIKFFDENEGGVAEAGIAILAPEKTPKLTYKLVAQSKVVKIQPYFGLDVELPLEQTMKVKAGDMVALTVPTWAPALALGFGKNTAWRASREAKACSVTDTETAQAELKSKVTYSCQYLTARLAYSATLISTP